MTPQQMEINAEEILLDCIEKGLDHFDRNFKTIVFFSLKTEENIEKRKIVQQPLTFANGLRRMFGVGYVAIEKSIVEEIGRRFGLSVKQQDLVSIISSVRNSYVTGGGRF